MDKLTIKVRMWWLVGSLGALMAFIGLLGASGLAASSASLKTVYEDRTVALADITDVSHFVQRNRVLFMDMLLNGSPENIKKRLAELQINLQEADKGWSAYMATFMTEEEKVLAGNLAALQKAYLEDALLPGVEALKNGQSDQARALYESKISPMAAPLRVAEVKLKKLQSNEAKREFESAVARYKTIRTIAAVTMIAGVTLALAFSHALVRGLTRSLETANRVATAIASGDLTTAVEVRGRDEVAELLRSMEKMQAGLTGVVANVRASSDSVATASAEIAQGNLDLSGRTEKQASALQETAATMEEIGSTVRNNADNAKQADALAQAAAGVAVVGGELVRQVAVTMEAISESSRKMSDIIGTIDGIAFQTNILALNAAVESARAGELGRGFAVVAGEVRTLAQRSADAAQEIRGLIERNVEQVGLGTSLVDRAGTTMGEVVSSIKQVSEVVAEITAATIEQSSGIQQVGDAVGQMDQVTQQNAALVEESAAAAESLKKQAQLMVEAVAFFKTPDASGGAAASSESEHFSTV